MVLEFITEGLNYLFNVGMTNINFLRVLMAVIIVSLVYNSLYNVFSGNKAAAIIISLIVAVIGVRFMPAELLLNLATFIWMFLLFAVPYLLVRKLFSRWWHAVIAALAVAAVLIYLLRGYLQFSFGAVGIEFGIPEFLQSLVYKVADEPFMVVLAICVVLAVSIFLGWLFKTRKAK